MTNKIPKSATQIILGIFMLSFTVIACNSKKKDGEPKEPPPDTAAVKTMDLLPPDTATKMAVPDASMKKDTLKKKPIKDPPPPPQ